MYVQDLNPVSDFFVPRSVESYAYVLGVQDAWTLLVRPRLRFEVVDV